MLSRNNKNKKDNFYSILVFGTKDSSGVSSNLFNLIFCCLFSWCFHNNSNLIIFENTLLVFD